jgi:hypothetical protein
MNHHLCHTHTHASSVPQLAVWSIVRFPICDGSVYVQCTDVWSNWADPTVAHAWGVSYNIAHLLGVFWIPFGK